MYGEKIESNEYADLLFVMVESCNDDKTIGINFQLKQMKEMQPDKSEEHWVSYNKDYFMTKNGNYDFDKIDEIALKLANTTNV